MEPETGQLTELGETVRQLNEARRQLAKEMARSWRKTVELRRMGDRQTRLTERVRMARQVNERALDLLESILTRLGITPLVTTIQPADAHGQVRSDIAHMAWQQDDLLAILVDRRRRRQDREQRQAEALSKQTVIAGSSQG